MQPHKQSEAENQGKLFHTRLDAIVDKNHPLVRCAERIDWSGFDAEFGALYAQGVGRPGLPTRLMVGLHYLKHTFDESDESVVERFVENPYWQYFCGLEHFTHEFPLDPSSLVRWRKRVGVSGVEKLLAESIETAQRSKLLKRSDVARVNVDTTVQEKAIAYPTDARLYDKMRRRLVREAGEQGIELRQSYVRLGKRALAKQGRYGHAKQMKRARRETRRLKTYLGSVLRDMQRKVAAPDSALQEVFALAERLLAQKRSDKNKLYAVHAPEVECIAKGKAHKRYEFGCKVSVVTTSKKNWVVGVDACHGNPYDGKTLAPALEQVARLTGWKTEQACCDQGYRGKQYWPEGIKVMLTGRRPRSASLRRWLWRRAAVEPVIGHMKSESRMDRNQLHGRDGDRMNSMLAGAGFNMRKLLRAFRLRLFYIARFWLFEHSSPKLSVLIAA